MLVSITESILVDLSKISFSDLSTGTFIISGVEIQLPLDVSFELNELWAEYSHSQAEHKRIYKARVLELNNEMQELCFEIDRKVKNI